MQHKYKKIITTGPFGTIIGHKSSEEKEVITLGQIGDYTYIFADDLSEQDENLVFEPITLTKSELAFLKQQAYIPTLQAQTTQKIKELVADYPEFEVDTFDIQEKEANDYSLDNTASTPFIDGICSQRGIGKEAFVAKVLVNAAGLKAYTAPIIGRYQKIIEAI